MRKWAGLAVAPFSDWGSTDDKNAKWHIDYCYWEAKPNPAAANEKIPQKLMIKGFADNYHTTNGKYYLDPAAIDGPPGEASEAADTAESDELPATGGNSTDGSQ